MSVYKKILEAVEEAIFDRQVKTVRECVWYVEWQTGLSRLDHDEISKIMHRAATAYKQ